MSKDSGHLSRDQRGIWVWRRVHPATRRRAKRSTGQRSRARAQLVAHAWEIEFERAAVGLATLNGWGLELAPLAEVWLSRLDVSERRRRQVRRDLLRVLDVLHLERANDLDEIARLDDHLLALPGVSRASLRSSYQAPLKRFSSWLAGNRRYLDRDPLAGWELIPAPRVRAARRGRAMEPEEVARALLALDRIAPSQRILFMVLLVAGPRVGALTSRDLRHFQQDRVDLGAGTEKKRRGAAVLDPATAGEMQRAVAGRVGGGPLFFSPRGGRWTKERLLDRWREAFGLGVVEQLWPAGEPRDPQLALLVADALRSGEARVSRGGNPERVRPETVRAREALARRVEQLAELLRGDWTARMGGVTLHAFRSTHKTWAAARGVPGAATDAQLGWASADDPGTLSVMRLAAGSRVGRRHYLDEGSSLLAPGASARAVRQVLDEALADLTAQAPAGQRIAP